MADIKAKYETILVISTTLGEEGVKAMVEKFRARIERHATLEGYDEWGKRRLAYPINDETEGYYVLYNFTSAPAFPAELDRVYKITDGILRSLIVSKDE